MENAGGKLDSINKTLEKQNEIVREMLDVMRKPENKFIRILETVVLVAGVLGILHTAELIRGWISGG